MAKNNKHPIGPDGLPAPCVGPWVEDKHGILRKYLKLHSHPRRRWIQDPRGNGAAYIDLFCGAGLAQIDGSDRFVDGSAVVAWKASVDDGVPFTKVVIADKDMELRDACAERLRRAGAPVVALDGAAIDAAKQIPTVVSPYGLHVVFLDPFNLGSLRFELVQSFSALRHVDILAHVSAMDLFRNYRAEFNSQRSEFDDFAPGWRAQIPAGSTDEEGRRALIEYWRQLVRGIGMKAEPDLQQIRNSVNRDLYWLMLIASAELAKNFWKVVLKYNSPQSGFDF